MYSLPVLTDCTQSLTPPLPLLPQALARCGRTALGAVDTLGLRENPRISTAGVDALAATLESGAFASLKTLWLPAAHEWHGGIAAACREREVTLICA